MGRSVSARRRRVLAAAGLAVAAVGLAGGCSAGLNTQTDATEPAVAGANASIIVSEDGVQKLSVRNVLVAYRDAAGYPAGSIAPLQLRVFNDTEAPVRLVRVEVDGNVAAGVVLTDGKATSGSTTTAAAPAPTTTVPSAPSPGSTTRAPGRAVTPSATAAAASPTPADEGAGGTVNIEIPAGGYVILAPGSGPYLQLTGLVATLDWSRTVRLAFHFSNGSTIANVDAPMNLPVSPGPRSPIPLNEGEGSATH